MPRFLKKFLLGLSLVAVPAVAQEGGHDDHDEHEEEFDVDAYPLVLQGEQAFGEACYLGVLKQGKRRGIYYAIVDTSFAHDGEGPGRLVVRFDPKNPKVLTGSNQDGGEVRIQLAADLKSIDDALSYAVRWTHEDHTDQGACLDLKVIKAPSCHGL